MRLQMIKQEGYTIFNLLCLFGFLAGAVIGGQYGYGTLGLAGGCAGTVIGGVVGALAGRLPYAFASFLVKRSLEKESIQQLRERLRAGNEYFITPLLLAHLMRRGEDITDELPVIIDLLKGASKNQLRDPITAPCGAHCPRVTQAHCGVCDPGSWHSVRSRRFFEVPNR